MEKIYILLICLGLSFSSFAQVNNDASKIALAVVMPENVDGLDVLQLSKLETKIAQIVTSAGLAASGYYSNFVIYPKLAIYESSIVEGGMQNITVVTVELSLFIKQVDNNILFSTISKQLKGSGYGKATAVTNAISKIPTNDHSFKKFIEDAKSKITNYYELACEGLIGKANTSSQMGKFQEAIATLLAIPEEVSCYKQAQQTAVKVFISQQNAICSNQIQSAKAAIASQDYNTAFDILSRVDPSSNCHKEADRLIQSTATKFDQEQRKQWEFKMKVYNDQVQLERQRISAIRDIAAAYYKSRPQTISYSTLIIR